MKCKQLGLRVLSTAAIMSIVTSIATSAFAGVYYINEGDITVSVDENGNVKVTQNGQDYDDKNGEVIIRGGTAADYADSAKESTEDKEETPEATTIGESEPVTQEAEEETPAEEEPEEEPVAEEQTEETEDVSEEPKAEEEAPAKEEEPNAEPEETVTEEEPEASEDEAETAEDTAEKTEKEDTPTPQITDDDTPLAAPVSENETHVENETETSAKREAPDTAMGDIKNHYTAKAPTSSAVDKVITVVNNWVDNIFKFTIENVNIKNTNKDKAAMSIQGKGDTTIELDGNNVLENESRNTHAVLEKNGNKDETGTLTITDTDAIDGDDSKRGSLTVNSPSGTGIGGGQGHSGENITIDGNAYVNASGYATGIGGGRSDSTTSSGQSGNSIHIEGNSYVVAKGYDRAIGGSNQGNTSAKGGDAKDIHISDTSTVYATGGIGSGGSGYSNANGGNTDIIIDEQSTVYANETSSSSGGGSAIGSGYGGTANITIGGQAKVKATNTNTNNVGIGSWGYEGTVTIKDDAIIGDGSSSIGASGNLDGAKVTVNILDRATIGTLGDNRYIGSKSDKFTSSTLVNIWNDVIVKGVNRIGSAHGNTTIKILDNASVKVGNHGVAIGATYGDTDITLGGNSSADSDQSGMVTIDASGSWNNENVMIGSIGNSKSKLTVDGGLQLTMTLADDKYNKNPRFICVDKNGITTEMTVEEVQKLLEEKANSYIKFVDSAGKTLRIPHSTDLCEPNADGTGVTVVASTCKTHGSKTFDCAYEANHGATDPSETDSHTVELPLDPDNHEQEAQLVGYKAPTCTEDGYSGDEVYPCCGAVKTKGHTIDKLGHAYGEWEVTTPATCTEAGEETRVCANDESHIETREIEATGHHYVDTVVAPTETEQGYTEHVCPDCGDSYRDNYTDPTGPAADENAVTAPELWVTAPDTIRQVFHVTQNGTTRTYTSPYNSGTLTGTMEILQYLQEQGVETIVFTTNQRTSRFAVADLLALVGEGDVFYLTHSDASEPTLLVVTNDHTDLLN